MMITAIKLSSDGIRNKTEKHVDIAIECNIICLGKYYWESYFVWEYVFISLVLFIILGVIVETASD